MSNPNRLELIDMALSILQQVKTSQEALNKVIDKADIQENRFINSSMWAKHVYNIVRGGVGLIEINANELKILSERDIYREPEDERDDDDE